MTASTARFAPSPPAPRSPSRPPPPPRRPSPAARPPSTPRSTPRARGRSPIAPSTTARPPPTARTAPCTPANPGSGSGDVAVSAQVAIFTDSTYHFRIRAANASGIVSGLDAGFTTPSGPHLGAISVDNRTYDSADVEASIDPNGVATTYRVEYGTTAAYGSTAPIPDGSIPAGSGAVPVTVHLTGLDPNATYHYHLVAESPNGGPPPSSDAVFTTLGKPDVEPIGSPIRTATTARLDSRLDPDGLATTYHFEYGTQGPCDSNPCTSTPDQSAGSGELTELVSAQLTNLDPATTYHYRLVADNAAPGAPVTGADPIPSPPAPPMTRSPTAPTTAHPTPTAPGSR